MKIFLTILFTIIAFTFFAESVDKTNLYKVDYILATAFMSTLLFLLYKL